MGRKKVAQRYAIWTERIFTHYTPETPFIVRDALEVLAEKYKTTYRPTSRQMAMVLRSDDRFASLRDTCNNLKMWYVRRK